jgi:hypothetical protein
MLRLYIISNYHTKFFILDSRFRGNDRFEIPALRQWAHPPAGVIAGMTIIVETARWAVLFIYYR